MKAGDRVVLDCPDSCFHRQIGTITGEERGYLAVEFDVHYSWCKGGFYLPSSLTLTEEA